MSRLTHGCAKSDGATPEWDAWSNMKQRCYYEKSIMYYRYGGRGIKVCERWRNDFRAFLEDMGLRPTNKHSLDRIDFDGDYTPSNCRWATTLEQASNRSDTRLLTFKGKTLSILGWAREVGMSNHGIKWRLDVLKWSVEKTLTAKKRKPKMDGLHISQRKSYYKHREEIAQRRKIKRDALKVQNPPEEKHNSLVK